MLKLKLFCLKNGVTSISRDETPKSQQKQTYNSKVAPYLSLIAGVNKRTDIQQPKNYMTISS